MVEAFQWGCQQGPILRTLDPAWTLSDLIHYSLRRAPTNNRDSMLVFFFAFNRILIKPSFIELIRFSSIFVLGRGTLHLPVCYVVLYEVPFKLVILHC